VRVPKPREPRLLGGAGWGRAGGGGHRCVGHGGLPKGWAEGASKRRRAAAQGPCQHRLAPGCRLRTSLPVHSARGQSPSIHPLLGLCAAHMQLPPCSPLCPTLTLSHSLHAPRCPESPPQRHSPHTTSGTHPSHRTHPLHSRHCSGTGTHVGRAVPQLPRRPA